MNPVTVTQTSTPCSRALSIRLAGEPWKMNHSESLYRGNEIEFGTCAAIRSILPVCANGRFSEDFANSGSHRYEDKGVSAAWFPALRDSMEDHVVPMTTVSSMEWNRVCGSAMLVRGCGCRMLLRLERRLGPASKRDVTGMRRSTALDAEEGHATHRPDRHGRRPTAGPETRPTVARRGDPRGVRPLTFNRCPADHGGPRRTALSNKRFTAKMTSMDRPVPLDPRHFNSGTEPYAPACITSVDPDCHPGPHGGRCGCPGARPDQRGPGNGEDRGRFARAGAHGSAGDRRRDRRQVVQQFPQGPGPPEVLLPEGRRRGIQEGSQEPRRPDPRRQHRLRPPGLRAVPPAERRAVRRPCRSCSSRSSTSRPTST